MGDKSRSRKAARDKRIKNESPIVADAPYKPTIGELESDDYYKAMFPDVKKESLPRQIQNAFDRYTGGMYREINGALDYLHANKLTDQARKIMYEYDKGTLARDPNWQAKFEKIIDRGSHDTKDIKDGLALSDYLNTQRVTENIMVRREETNRSPVYKAIEEGYLTTGSVISRGGLTSATVANDYSLTKDHKRVEYKIKVPKGTKGAYIANVSSLELEAEFLFPSGARFRITKITKTGVRHMPETAIRAERDEGVYEVELEAL